MNNILLIIEAALFAAHEPLNIFRLQQLFENSEKKPSQQEIRCLLQELMEFYQGRGVELVEVASGFRFQTRVEYTPWLRQLLEKRPPTYSRALLETLALIVYRQPIARGEIEAIRGVAVSSQIIRTLLDRKWIRIVGYKDVPGKPALYGTTQNFLDDFNLKNLSELPPLHGQRIED